MHENMPLPLEGPIDLLRDNDRMMSFGERAALEGLLAQACPRVAIEIGTAQGGTLARVAEYSEEVHAFDLACSLARARGLANVSFHEGDNHLLLPKVLRRLREEGRNVDFVVVDGDHSADGVRRDLVDLLESPALGRSLVLVHDTANEAVRAGIERVPFERYPKVEHVDLDFVAGYMFREPSLRHELWGGLGLVVVNQDRESDRRSAVRQDRYYEAFRLLREGKHAVVKNEGGTSAPGDEPSQYRHELAAAQEQLRLLRAHIERVEDAARRNRAELEQLLIWHRQVTTSLSWRITAPLRAAARAVRQAGAPARRLLGPR